MSPISYQLLENLGYTVTIPATVNVVCLTGSYGEQQLVSDEPDEEERVIDDTLV
jgi:hypothetical protein